MSSRLTIAAAALLLAISGCASTSSSSPAAGPGGSAAAPTSAAPVETPVVTPEPSAPPAASASVCSSAPAFETLVKLTGLTVLNSTPVKSDDIDCRYEDPKDSTTNVSLNVYPGDNIAGTKAIAGYPDSPDFTKALKAGHQLVLFDKGSTYTITVISGTSDTATKDYKAAVAIAKAWGLS